MWNSKYNWDDNVSFFFLKNRELKKIHTLNEFNLRNNNIYLYSKKKIYLIRVFSCNVLNIL